VLRAITEWILQHQTLLFAVIGAFAGVIAIVILRMVGRIEIFADLTHGEAAAAGPRRYLRLILGSILLLAVGIYLGVSYGRSQPIVATTVLGMPDLTCDHHGRKLVLFLHGWQGDREETWKRFPDLVCGDYDFRDYDVLSIGYPTYYIGSNLTMQQFGGWLADKLAANNIQRYDKIAIIAHSIGGLLARRIVLEQRPELKNIVLLVEIGTPHLGAYDYTKLADNIFMRGGRLVGELQTGSPFLQQLQADWEHLPQRPHTFCTGSPSDYVVSLDSAQDDCDEQHAYPALDHRGLVKPTDIREDRYKVPMHAVKRHLD